MSKKKTVNVLVVMTVLLSSFNLLGEPSISTNQEPQTNQKSRSLSEVINNGALLVDVRTSEEFSAGHVPGSINIPLVTVQDNIDQFKDKGDVVVFCQSGGRSARALNILIANGVTNVYNGGGWENVKALVKK